MLLVQPVMGLLLGNESVEVTLRYRRPAGREAGWAPADDLHHFSISHIPAPDNATARGVWHEHHGPPIGIRRIRCQFQ